MKATKKESADRVKYIYQLMVDAYTYTEIIQQCTQKFKIKKRQVDKYIAYANKRVLDDNKQSIEEIRAEATARYKKYIKKLEEKEKYSEAALIQRRIDKINGLEIENINMNNTGQTKLIIEYVNNEDK